MEKIKGAEHYIEITPAAVKDSVGKEITLRACVDKIENMGAIFIVMLRTGRYTFQSVFNSDTVKDIAEGTYIIVRGVPREEKRAVYGYEITVLSYEILSVPKESYPVPVTARHMGISVETSMEHRTASMRNREERAVIKIRESLISLMREYFTGEYFTEISSPKITTMTEDRKTAFKIKYFDERACLLSSLSLYTSMSVAFFDRVFEIGSVYSAKRHGSARYLNEFTQLDFEMAYADNADDIISVGAAVIEYILKKLPSRCQNELDMLNVSLPKPNMVSVTFYEALEIAGKPKGQYDLDPTDENKLRAWARDKHNSDFVFVKNYPAKKRSFNEKSHADDTLLTEGFDLIFKGLSVARGSIKINDYDEQLLKLKERREKIDIYAPYLDTLKCGMPPFGGMSVGIERFLTRLLNLDDVRQATLFPRDLHFVTP